jgi:hypothetical protein
MKRGLRIVEANMLSLHGSSISATTGGENEILLIHDEALFPITHNEMKPRESSSMEHYTESST